MTKASGIFYSSMLILTVILLDLLGGAEIDIFVPSFPELQKIFDISVFEAEGLLSANFIGSVFALLFIGSLADKYGYKPIIIGGIAIFIIGSVSCLYATSYTSLITGRFLQGIGIAAPSSLYFVIIADNYPMKKQQFLMGIMNGIMNAAVAAAPVLGSYITIHYKWQGNFIVLLLAGILVLAMTVVFVPNKKIKTREDASSKYQDIFSSKILILLLANLIFKGLPYWVFLGMSSIIYVEALGVDLAHYGYYQGTWALTFAIGSVIAGIATKYVKSKNMLILAAYVSLLSLIAIGLITIFDSKSPTLIAMAFLIFSIAEIIPSTVMYPLCINLLPNAKGKISSFLYISRMILSAIFVQIAGYLNDYQPEVGRFNH
jgi:MFS transporter, DHA1 family, multidrug resistance protein